MFVKRYEKIETIVVEQNNGVSPPAQPIPPPSSLSRPQINWTNLQRKWIGQMSRPECYDENSACVNQLENIMARLTDNVGVKLNETKHDSSLDTTIMTSTPNGPSSRSLLPPPRVSCIRTPLATNQSLQNISANILQNKSKSLGKRKPDFLENNSISVAKKQRLFQSAQKPGEFMPKFDSFKHYQVMHSDSPHGSPPTPNIIRNMDIQQTIFNATKMTVEHFPFRPSNAVVMMQTRDFANNVSVQSLFQIPEVARACTLEAINEKKFGLVGYPDSGDSRYYDNDVHLARYESSERLESLEDERDDEEEEESQIEQPCDDGHFSQPEDYDSSRNSVPPVDRNDSDNDYDKSEQQHESLQPISSNANLANIYIMRNNDMQKTMHIKREKCTLEAINEKTFGLVGYPDSDDSRNYDNDVHSAGYESSERLESSEDERDDEEEEESQIEQPCDDGHFSQPEDYDSSRNSVSPVDRNDSDNDYDKSEQQHKSLRPITSNANLANIESDDDEPIVIRRKKTKHNASLKRRILDQILANDKIIVPSVAGNSFQRRCRRSKRLRVKPLNFWCGERPIYKAEQINGSSVLSLVGATAAQMEPLRRKLAPRKKRKASRVTEDTRPIVEPVAPATIEQKMDNILDLSIQVKKYKNLSKNMAANDAEHITSYGSIQFNESKNSPGLYTSITKKAGDIAMGKIKFDPEVTKTTTKTGDYVTYFNVVYGTLLLKVESKPDSLVKTGSLFEIGPNMRYSIINTRSDQAMIDFNIVRVKT